MEREGDTGQAGIMHTGQSLYKDRHIWVCREAGRQGGREAGRQQESVLPGDERGI